MNCYVDRVAGQRPGRGKLLQKTELWFVPVANPDGYQYTFDHERLWRKNLRDNNGNGQIQVGDGVDPNRNFPNHWGYDKEGSSSIPSSDTYRGPSPVSEPETQAMIGLLRPRRLRLPGQLPLVRPVAALPRGLADRHRRPRTTRSTTRCPATSTTPPSRASTRASAPTSSTSPTARRPTTPTRAAGRWPGRRSCPRAAPAAGSSSRTTRRWCRPSSSATCRSPTRSPTRRATPTTRSRSTGLTTKPFYLESDDPYKGGVPGRPAHASRTRTATRSRSR